MHSQHGCSHRPARFGLADHWRSDRGLVCCRQCREQAVERRTGFQRQVGWPSLPLAAQGAQARLHHPTAAAPLPRLAQGLVLLRLVLLWMGLLHMGLLLLLMVVLLLILLLLLLGLLLLLVVLLLILLLLG